MTDLDFIVASSLPPKKGIMYLIRAQIAAERNGEKRYNDANSCTLVMEKFKKKNIDTEAIKNKDLDKISDLIQKSEELAFEFPEEYLRFINSVTSPTDASENNDDEEFKLEELQDIFGIVTALYVIEKPDLKTFIIDNYDELMQDTLNRVYQYGKYYNVQVSDSLDDMKITYMLFLSLRNSKKLSNSLKIQANIAMLFVLNRIVFVNTNHLVSQHIFRKLVYSARAGSFEEHFGLFGAYSIFKNIYKTHLLKKQEKQKETE